MEENFYNQVEHRPESLPSRTYCYKMLCGKKLYVTVTYIPEESNRPFEVFINVGKSARENDYGSEKLPGETAYCHLGIIEALGRTISNYLRAKCDPNQLIKTYRNIKCAYYSPNPSVPNSCPDAISRVIDTELNGNNVCHNCGKQSDDIIKYYTRIGKLPYYLCEACKEQLATDQNLMPESEYIEIIEHIQQQEVGEEPS